MQSSLGMQPDPDEDEREPEESYSPAPAMPEDNADRESTSPESPNFQIPKQDDTPAAEAETAPEDDGAPSAPPAQFGTPLQIPAFRNPVSPRPRSLRGQDDSEVSGAVDEARNPAPKVVPRPDAVANGDYFRGQHIDAQKRAGLFQYLHQSGISVSTGPDGQPRVDTDEQGNPQWQPVASAPYQNDKGDWVRQSRGPTGHVSEVNLQDAGEYRVDPRTGDMMSRDAAGQPISIGKDQPTIQKLAISSQRKQWQFQNQQDELTVAQVNQAVAPLRQQVAALQHSTPLVGGVPAPSNVRRLESDAQSSDPLTSGPAQETLSKWNADHPEYAQAKAALDAANQAVSARRTAILQRRQNSLTLATAPNGPQVGALLAPNYQDAASPGMTPGQTTPDHIQLQAASDAARAGTTMLAALPGTLARLRAAGINVPTVTPAQYKAAPAAAQPADTGFDPLEFGKRILTGAAQDIYDALEGASRWAGNEDMAQLFKTTSATYGLMNDPAAENRTSSKWAKVLGGVVATIPATMIATAAAPEVIGAGAIGFLANAGKVAWNMAPIAAQFGAAASAEAYDQTEGTPEEKRAAGASAAWKTVRALPAYMAAGAIGGKIEGAILAKLTANPELMNPFVRGVSAFLTHSIANVGASTALRAYEQEPGVEVAPNLENIRQDIAFAGQGAISEGMHQRSSLSAGQPARAAFGSLQDIPEAKRAAYAPIAQAILDGKEPSVMALDKMATDPASTPEQKAQAKGAADIMRLNAEEFLNPTPVPDDPGQTYRDTLKHQSELQGKIDTAANPADRAAIVDQFTANTTALHNLAQTRTDALPPEQRARIASAVDPKADVTSTDEQIRKNPQVAFAAQAIGSDPLVRAAHLDPSRENAVKIVTDQAADPIAAKRLSEQHVGLMVGRDLWGVVSDLNPISMDKAQALQDPSVGLLVEARDANGQPVMKLTEDALHLLTDAQRTAIAAKPDRFLIDPSAGTPQSLFQQHVQSGMRQGVQLFSDRQASAKPTQHNVTVTTQATGEAAPTPKTVPVLAHSEPQAHAKAVSALTKAGHTVIDSGIDPSKQPAGGTTAPERPHAQPLDQIKANVPAGNQAIAAPVGVDAWKAATPKVPVEAIWRNEGQDVPVKITGVMGEKNGEAYLRTEGGTGIPSSQVRPVARVGAKSSTAADVTKAFGGIGEGFKEAAKKRMADMAEAGTPQTFTNTRAIELARQDSDLVLRDNPDGSVTVTGVKSMPSVVKFEPIKHADLSDTGKAAVARLMPALMKNRKALAAMGIHEPTFVRTLGKRQTSGLTMDGRELKIDGDHLSRQIEELAGMGVKPSDWAEHALNEEVIHRAQIIGAARAGVGFDAFYTQLRNDPKLDPKLVEMARKAYGDFDQLTPAAQGAEITRMVIQQRWTGTITEHIIKAIQHVIDFLKGLNVGHSDLLASAVKQAEDVLAEARNKTDEPINPASTGKPVHAGAEAPDASEENPPEGQGGSAETEPAGPGGDAEGGSKPSTPGWGADKGGGSVTVRSAVDQKLRAEYEGYSGRLGRDDDGKPVLFAEGGKLIVPIPEEDAPINGSGVTLRQPTIKVQPGGVVEINGVRFGFKKSNIDEGGTLKSVTLTRPGGREVTISNPEQAHTIALAMGNLESENRRAKWEPDKAGGPPDVEPGSEEEKETAHDALRQETNEHEDLFGPAEEPAKGPDQSVASNLPIIEAPIGKLKLSDDVPQFKKDANEKGITEPLAGKFERTGVGPIQLWQRLNGDLEVISGRHRFDLAQRSGEKTIPAQIHREADGFNARAAQSLDAILNIRDGQGSVADYANFFRASKTTREEADAQGLLGRAKGKAGFQIGAGASDDTFALHQAGRLTDAQAEAIASAAPGNDAAQRVGVRAALDGAEASEAGNIIKAALLSAKGEKAEQSDFFSNASLDEQWKKQGKIASSKQREIREQIASVQGAAKRPEVAKKLGVDIKDPAGVQKRIDALKGEQERWQNWPSHPDLVAATLGKEATKADLPKLRSKENQGDLLANQAEDLRLIGESGTDGDAKAKEQARQEAESKASKEKFDREQQPLFASRAKRDAGTGDLFAPFAPEKRELDQEALKSAPERTQNLGKWWSKLNAKLASGEALTPPERARYEEAEAALGQKYLFAPEKRETPKKVELSAKDLAARRLTGTNRPSQTDIFTGKPEDERGGQSVLFAARAKRDELGFYSALEKVAGEKINGRMGVDQLRGTLKGAGVKDAEIEHTIGDLLAERKASGKPITPEELRDEIAGNAVQIKAIQKKEDAPHWTVDDTATTERYATEKEAQRAHDRAVNSFEENLTEEAENYGKLNFSVEPDDFGDGFYVKTPQGDSEYFDTEEEADERAEALVQEEKDEIHKRALDEVQLEQHDAGEGDTKFGQYQLPGGTNYQEELLTLPSSSAEVDALREKMLQKYGEGWYGKQTDQEFRDFAAAEEKAKSTSGFESSHWDEPNVVAHVRHNDREDTQSRKLLHMEEAQSDWHQKGRKEGYVGDEMTPSDTERRNHLVQKSFTTEGLADAEQKEYDALDVKLQRPNNIPNAPFKGEGWKRIALKRMLAKAAEGNYDGLSWTAGEDQAARYDLSKQVDKIQYDQERGALWGYKNGSRIVSETGVTPEKLADFIGKDAAEKLLEKHPESVTSGEHAYSLREISGEDLKVGGKGMLGFYDRELTNIAGDLVKRFGVKVGKTEIATPGYERGETRPAHFIPINDAMRKAFTEEGQSLFASFAGRRAADYEDAKSDGRTFPGPYDGKDRFEIDDSKMKITDEGVGWLVGKTGETKLGDLIDHEELFRNYPDLRDEPVTRMKGEGADAGWNGIRLGEDMPMRRVMPALVHEIQHLIQQKEGFDRGASPESINRMRGGATESGEPHPFSGDDNADYRRTGGEIEAQEAASRFQMTPEQRAAEKPFSRAPKPEDALMRGPDGMRRASEREASPLGAAAAKATALGSALNSFSPASAGQQAESTALNIREHGAERANRAEQAHAQLEASQKLVDRMSKADQLQAFDDMEHGRAQANPALDAVAKPVRKMLDDKAQDVQALGTGALKATIKDYLPHLYKDPKAAAEFFGAFAKRPIQGNKNFLKKRTIPTLRDAMQWRVNDKDGAFVDSYQNQAAAIQEASKIGGTVGKPLEPVSTNMVTMALLQMHQMDKFIMAHRVLNEERSGGRAAFISPTRKAPDGWTKVNDPIGTVYGPNVMQGLGAQAKVNLDMKQSFVEAQTIRGHWYMPDESARVLNNYLSPGLAGTPVYDALRGISNRMNSVQLGLSLFHLGFEAVNSTVAHTALGLGDVLRGKVGAGLGKIATAPLALFTNASEGSKVLKEMQRPGSQGGDFAKMADSVIAAGGRGSQDAQEKTGDAKAFFDAFKKGGNKADILRAPFAVVEMLSHPLMGLLVPRLKLGAFAGMARQALDRLGPGATREQVRKAMAESWDSVDNRFGQLVYDNLFWHNALKHTLMLGTRSVGWNLGTVREVGGGIKDALTTTQRVKAGGQAVTPRMLYTFSLPITVGLMGAVYQMLSSGKRPGEQDDGSQGSLSESLKDYFNPRTGRTLPDGTAERVRFASYMRDVSSYAQHPISTVIDKMGPLVSAMSQMLSNKDYYGTKIVNGSDPIVKKVEDEGRFVASQFVPFSLTSSQHRQNPSARTFVESQLGVTPAPAQSVRTPAMQLLHDSSELEFHPSREERAISDKKYKLVNDLRKPPEGKTASQLAQKAIRGGLPIAKAQSAIKESREPAKLPAFRHAGIQAAEAAFKVATPDEKRIWGPLLAQKRARALSRGMATN